jgi:hypothetical protein
MPRTSPEKIPFSLTDADKRIMLLAEHDLGLFTEHYYGIKPIPWQKFVYHKPQKRKALLAGIRAGKTMGVSLGFCHYAHYHPYAKIANASISADQAKVVFYNVLSMVSRPRYEKFVAHVERSPYPMIRLENGAEMWFRSTGYEAEYWRGWEFDWINGDEFAYVNNKTTVTTLTGRLIGRNPFTGRPRAGKFSVSSSPHGRNWLYELWRRGDPNFPEYNPKRYLSLRVRTLDNPNISREEVEALMEEYSQRQIDQELEGKFLDPEGAVFSFESITSMCDITRPEVANLVRRIEELSEDPGPDGFIPKKLGKADYEHYELPPQDNHEYVAAWDLGTTATSHKGRNATVGFVIDITPDPWQVIAYRREIKASYPMIMQWIREWDGRYKNRGQSTCNTVIDATGSGKPVEEILQEEHNLDVDGASFNDATKPDIINAGQVCLDRGWFVMPPIRQVIDEFSSYELADKRIVQDCVMGLCVGLHRARRRSDKNKTSQSNLILPTRSREFVTGSEMQEYMELRYLERRGGARQVRSSRAPRRSR